MKQEARLILDDGTEFCGWSFGYEANAVGEVVSSFIRERHRHRYEFNNTYREAFEQAGMHCSGINPQADLVEIVEIPALRWYIGTQFHPEYSSTVLHPHPLFMSFVKACALDNLTSSPLDNCREKQ